MIGLQRTMMYLYCEYVMSVLNEEHLRLSVEETMQSITQIYTTAIHCALMNK